MVASVTDDVTGLEAEKKSHQSASATSTTSTTSTHLQRPMYWRNLFVPAIMWDTQKKPKRNPNSHFSSSGRSRSIGHCTWRLNQRWWLNKGLTNRSDKSGFCWSKDADPTLVKWFVSSKGLSLIASNYLGYTLGLQATIMIELNMETKQTSNIHIEHDFSKKRIWFASYWQKSLKYKKSTPYNGLKLASSICLKPLSHFKKFSVLRSSSHLGPWQP